MAKRKKPPQPAPESSSEPDLRQRVWQNGWGMAMAALTLAPLNPDGSEPAAEGIRVWFEPPRHGWLYPHIDLVGYGEFVCRASDVENDFLGDLIGALRGVLSDPEPTRAEAFGEPQSFDFRFAQTEGVRCDIVTYNKFAAPSVEEPILSLTASTDDICRAFCFGIRELHRAVVGKPWEYAHPFPADALTALCAQLGGEFADGVV